MESEAILKVESVINDNYDAYTFLNKILDNAVLVGYPTEELEKALSRLTREIQIYRIKQYQNSSFCV